LKVLDLGVAIVGRDELTRTGQASKEHCHHPKITRLVIV
jgi:hypothetical protein